MKNIFIAFGLLFLIALIYYFWFKQKNAESKMAFSSLYSRLNPVASTASVIVENVSHSIQTGLNYNSKPPVEVIEKEQAASTQNVGTPVIEQANTEGLGEGLAHESNPLSPPVLDKNIVYQPATTLFFEPSNN